MHSNSHWKAATMFSHGCETYIRDACFVFHFQSSAGVAFLHNLAPPCWLCSTGVLREQLEVPRLKSKLAYGEAKFQRESRERVEGCWLLCHSG